MEKVFAVIGLGTFGQSVCRVLADRGAKVIAMDSDPELIERIKETVTQAVLVDATDADALTSAPLADVDIAVVAIGTDVQSSILTTALLKEFAVPYVLARAISDLHHRVLRQVGADEVVNIEVDSGTRVANRLVAPDILDEFPISADISIAEVRVPANITGSTLTELDLRSRHNVNVVAIRRAQVTVDEVGNPRRNETVVFPSPTDRLSEDDTILIVGRNQAIEQFKQV